MAKMEFNPTEGEISRQYMIVFLAEAMLREMEEFQMLKTSF
jgi:hypothetical protein